MAVTRMYVPEIGQTDAAARAAALNAGLSVPDTADAPRYARIRDQLPCVVLEWGEEIVVVAEPTTLGAIDAAAAQLQQAADDAEAVATPDAPEITGVATGLLAELLTALQAQGIITDGTVHA